MDEIVFDKTTTEDMRVILSALQEQYGQLKLFSSRALQETTIDEILRIIISFLRNRLGMYDIKIFNNLQKESTYLPTFAKCYNYLLLNTNFPLQSLLSQDVMFGHVVGFWPTLSPYLFIQIIWYSQCEDLLIESLMHIPLDLCVEILEITIKHLNELTISRARRLIFHLLNKLYNKCLWLHLGTISAQNMTKNIQKLLMYFEILLQLLISPKFITHNLFNEKKYFQHGILVKNILQCIKKCMHSKIKNYLENYNLTRFFRLTYGNYYNNAKYYQMFPASEIKSIILRLDHKLATLLLNQIKYVDSSEYKVWKNIRDDEITVISLHRAIIIECHYLREFMKQNNFLITNEQMCLCLKQLIGPRISEKYILTIQELCHRITESKLYGMKELIRRYKEWDLCTLDFIKQKINLLSLNDYYFILEYLYYKFTYFVHTKVEKYRIYISVLKILIHLNEQDLHYIILKYMKKHFDDNCLEELYDKNSFYIFIRQHIFIEKFNDSQSMMDVIAQKCRSLLIFILLNPKAVLSKLIYYEMEISIKSSYSILFQHNMLAFYIQNYYSLKKDECNVLTYILKNMILNQGKEWHTNYKTFITRALDMMTADDVINELYIPYLMNSCIEEISIDGILSHTRSILQKTLCTKKTKFIVLILILIQKASLLRKFDSTFSKFQICRWIEIINEIVECISKKCFNLYKNFDQNFHQDEYRVEPLDMKNGWPKMSALDIIWEYEKRYRVIYQQLCVNPRCHPTLRSYLQSFKLDREAFIRHMILHCVEMEYVKYMSDLTFKFWYYLGWTDEMMAYENIMRITVDVSQIVLMYFETFPKDTFVLLLFEIVQFCKNVTKRMPHDKYEVIRQILLRNLTSIKHMANRTHYRDIYNILLERIKAVDPYLNRQQYFQAVFHKVAVFLTECEPLEPDLYADW
ncbi:hypothetical protein ALC62_08988 [Cyphomyrmex costatus]|uniref:Uncharacterized protein n=1 Tax=Cyphomyrmex costatus TaxID=456900 RepID=A0A151IGA4_9HYME|nr:hypothetical protein ALC62_08988 [Cyphomyrmex costatus]